MTLQSFFIVTFAILLASCSKSQDPICTDLDSAIDTNIKKIALTLVDGEMADKGAMQQAARYTMINNRLLVISANLELQSKHNCAIRKTPIDPMSYGNDALKCYSATLTEKDKAASACNFKSWKGDQK